MKSNHEYQIMKYFSATLCQNLVPQNRGCSSDIASYYFRLSKITEHVTSRVSGGEFKTK